ncbi:phosphatidylinositol-4-phosphate 5-kinase, putative [Bodo saltans]|uniref:Phosphatidylinositol-4-phosphate 5-kinase, putative n=1 Tax=Bodo saltans TaxID=75058 RepID=A0A0S4JL23_BODSA|nr:phosphatidylinositol-4-phosphate 5-kinase, putative [Bodo saltans]|eukprot:CUG90827.1 phosphatidylinositol-4-phosphate 5-kinase, putative [Bodo saltans]
MGILQTPGGTYDGAFVNNMKHGWGRYTSSSSANASGTIGLVEYEGEWHLDQPSGKCLGAVFRTAPPSATTRRAAAQPQSTNSAAASSDTFEYYGGMCVNGRPHGEGRLTYKDGKVYQGEFSNGQRHGRGSLQHVNGDVYEGEFVEGKCHGEARETTLNGARTFAGTFRQGKRDRGKMIFGDLEGKWYDGEWQQDRPHGRGTQKQPNGDLYTGWFVEGKFCGYGEFYYSDTGATFRGPFQDGLPHGEGTIDIPKKQASFPARFTNGRLDASSAELYRREVSKTDKLTTKATAQRPQSNALAFDSDEDDSGSDAATSRQRLPTDKLSMSTSSMLSSSVREFTLADDDYGNTMLRAAQAQHKQQQRAAAQDAADTLWHQTTAVERFKADGTPVTPPQQSMTPHEKMQQTIQERRAYDAVVHEQEEARRAVAAAKEERQRIVADAERKQKESLEEAQRQSSSAMAAKRDADELAKRQHLEAQASAAAAARRSQEEALAAKKKQDDAAAQAKSAAVAAEELQRKQQELIASARRQQQNDFAAAEAARKKHEEEQRKKHDEEQAMRQKQLDMLQRAEEAAAAKPKSNKAEVHQVPPAIVAATVSRQEPPPLRKPSPKQAKPLPQATTSPQTMATSIPARVSTPIADEEKRRGAAQAESQRKANDAAALDAKRKSDAAAAQARQQADTAAAAAAASFAKRLKDDAALVGTLSDPKTVAYANGDAFEGCVGSVSKKPEGRGHFDFADGRTYDGDFHLGLRHGAGTLASPNGDKYEGGFLDGKQHGKGHTISMNGTRKFDGIFDQGRKVSGKMQFLDQNGKWYDGTWADEKPHGYGTQQQSNGDVYTGEFVAGRYHGKGEMDYASDHRILSGNFEGDKPRGPCQVAYKDGKVMELTYDASTGALVDKKVLKESPAAVAAAATAKAEKEEAARQQQLLQQQQQGPDSEEIAALGRTMIKSSKEGEVPVVSSGDTRCPTPEALKAQKFKPTPPVVASTPTIKAFKPKPPAEYLPDETQLGLNEIVRNDVDQRLRGKSRMEAESEMEEETWKTVQDQLDIEEESGKPAVAAGIVIADGFYKKYNFSATSVYTGLLKRNGMREGPAKYACSSFVYQGMFLNDKRHGYGVLKAHPKSSAQIKLYQGNWKDDKKEDVLAHATISGGDVYIGGFHDNIFHGAGRYQYADGKVYEGQYQNGIRHGKGRLTLPNGDVYEGEFVNGAMTGTCTWVTQQQTRVFVGTVLDGKKQAGRIVFHDQGGKCFDGAFVNEKPHGRGAMLLSNGDVYRGDLDQGVFHGQGVLYYISENKSYVGSFVQGKPHGKGTLRNHTDPTLHAGGEWTNGKRAAA